MNAPLILNPCVVQVCKINTDTLTNPMLFCDSCDAAHHCECLKPKIQGVPEGDWLCPTCIQSRPTLAHLLPTPKEQEEVLEAQNKPREKRKPGRPPGSGKPAAGGRGRGRGGKGGKGGRGGKATAKGKATKKAEAEISSRALDRLLEERRPEWKATLIEDATLKKKEGGGLPTVALPERLASTKLPSEHVSQSLQAWDVLNFFMSKVAHDNLKQPGSTWADFESMLCEPEEAVLNSHIHRFHMVVLEMLLSEVPGDGKDAFSKMPITCYTWPILLRHHLEKTANHEILHNREAAPFTTLADLLAVLDYE